MQIARAAQHVSIHEPAFCDSRLDRYGIESKLFDQVLEQPVAESQGLSCEVLSLAQQDYSFVADYFAKRL
jgi:hypothetical protein